jgi:hypothetical protein
LMDALRFSETSALPRATRRTIPEDTILCTICLWIHAAASEDIETIFLLSHQGYIRTEFGLQLSADRTCEMKRHGLSRRVECEVTDLCN